MYFACHVCCRFRNLENSGFVTVFLTTDSIQLPTFIIPNRGAVLDERWIDGF